MSLAQIAPSAFEITDILVSRAIDKQVRSGNTLSCKPACAACCRQMVPVSAPEAFLIMDMIHVIQKEFNSGLPERFKEVENTVKKNRLLFPLLEDEYDDNRMMDLAERYFWMQMPCPFLENDSCTIYPYRPVACREYNVTSPPENCRTPYSGLVKRISMPTPLSLPLAQLANELTKTEVRLIPLSLVPIWVSSHRHLAEKTWPGVELFPEFLNQLNRIGKTANSSGHMAN
jgi:Fe-S-cluster containining protein